MVDIESMFRALKATWIFRLNAADPTKHSWAQLANFFIIKVASLKDILGYSLDNETAFPALKDVHPFYKEVLYGYTYANVVNLKQFCSSIYSQSLWGNRFINVNTRRKKNVLYLRNWIRSGVNKVGDLKFIDGKVDEAYLYQVVQRKTNIHAEILLVKKALEPYTQTLVHNDLPQNYDSVEVIMKSKALYMKLVDTKCNRIQAIDMCPNLHHMCTQLDIGVKDAFRNQLCSNIETKLREFNFKVMHNILPCNSNLKKWRKRENDVCDICNCKQTIEHLLFECHRAVNLWKCVEETYQITVSFSNIVCGLRDYDMIFNHIITLLAFLLYKEWLLTSLEYKIRRLDFPCKFFISELKLRERIYFANGVDLNVSPIIQCLEDMDVV